MGAAEPSGNASGKFKPSVPHAQDYTLPAMVALQGIRAIKRRDIEEHAQQAWEKKAPTEERAPRLHKNGSTEEIVQEISADVKGDVLYPPSLPAGIQQAEVDSLFDEPGIGSPIRKRAPAIKEDIKASAIKSPQQESPRFTKKEVDSLFDEPETPPVSIQQKAAALQLPGEPEPAPRPRRTAPTKKSPFTGMLPLPKPTRTTRPMKPRKVAPLPTPQLKPPAPEKIPAIPPIETAPPPELEQAVPAEPIHLLVPKQAAALPLMTPATAEPATAMPDLSAVPAMAERPHKIGLVIPALILLAAALLAMMLFLVGDQDGSTGTPSQLVKVTQALAEPGTPTGPVTTPLELAIEDKAPGLTPAPQQKQATQPTPQGKAPPHLTPVHDAGATVARDIRSCFTEGTDKYQIVAVYLHPGGKVRNTLINKGPGITKAVKRCVRQRLNRTMLPLFFTEPTFVEWQFIYGTERTSVKVRRPRNLRQ